MNRSRLASKAISVRTGSGGSIRTSVKVTPRCTRSSPLPVRDQKGALIDLQQDGTRYFDLHHTPDDTLDKIDIAQLRQNVAVWAQVVGILANEDTAILTGTPVPSAPPIMQQ